MKRRLSLMAGLVAAVCAVAVLATQLASDSFNRANENPLNATNWTNVSGHPLQVVTNMATLVDDNFSASTYTGISWSGVNDQYAQITLVTLQSGKDAGLLLRSTGAYFSTDTAYLCIINSLDAALTLGVTTLRIQVTKTVNNAFTDLDFFDKVISANDVLYFEAQGSTLKVKVNGVFQTFSGSGTTSITDSAVTAGSPGIYISSGTSSLTNFDDFSAGDFGGATTTCQALTLTGVGRCG